MRAYRRTSARCEDACMYRVRTTSIRRNRHATTTILQQEHDARTSTRTTQGSAWGREPTVGAQHCPRLTTRSEPSIVNKGLEQVHASIGPRGRVPVVSSVNLT